MLYFIEYNNNKAVKWIVTEEYCSPKHITGPKCIQLPANNVIISKFIKGSKATLSEAFILLRITATLRTFLTGHTDYFTSLYLSCKHLWLDSYEPS